MAENKLNISELDFDNIKSNLRTYLKDQSEFSDYNFEGSGLSVLLDVLAYNTHYMSFYLNMVANEMFIDTAATRPSVVSHAKLLGYTPRSTVASQAKVNISVQEVIGGSNSSMTLPRFTRFSSQPKDGASYVFVNPEQRVVTKNTAGYFNFPNVVIKEGAPTGYTFTYSSQTNPKQVFELPDANIDTSTLVVQIQTSLQNGNVTSFTLAEDATEVASTSNVYFLEENRNGRYQIYFGDNIIGKSLEDGNIVIVSYIVTNGSIANDISTFKIIDNVMPGATITLTTVDNSNSGKEIESIDDIRMSAPKAFISQNRAVTKNDYIALINKKYPYYDSVAVWGGEQNVPPVYGKMFFSLKPQQGKEITAAEVEYIKNKVIAPFSVLTVVPEYIQADYTYLNLIADVVYDPRKTSLTAGALQTALKTNITNYCDVNLNTFNNTFKLSRLARVIDDTNPSIENNTITIILEKRFKPVVGQTKNYRLDFYTPLKRGTGADRIYSEPSFEYYDNSQIERTCYIEEEPQSFTGIDEISITASGSGYTEIPEIVIEGDGQGATASAIIVNGQLKSVIVTNEGSGYSSAIARVVGGSGTGATVKPILQGRRGNLRLYYYDSNNIKKIVKNIGDIYYDDGYLMLTDFNPISVDDAFGTMTFKAIPDATIISTKRNSILTLDPTDPGSISIRITPLSEI